MLVEFRIPKWPPAPWVASDTFHENLFVPVRLILALFVLVDHSHGLTIPGSSDPLKLLTHGQASFGDFAVNMFLAISGFLVSYSWSATRSMRAFLAKRVLRLCPAFWAVMLLQAFVLAPLVSRGPFDGYNAQQLALIAFEMVNLVGYGYPYGGLLEVFPGNPQPLEMNASLWTLRYEFLCYAALAVGAATVRRKWLVYPTFAVVWALYAAGWHPRWHWVLTGLFNAPYSWPRLLAYFLAGVTFYCCRKRVPHSGLLAVVGFGLLAVGSQFPPHGLPAVMPLCGTYCLFWVAYHPVLVRAAGRIAKGPDYSYGTYLCGFPVQQSLLHWAPLVIDFNPWRLTATAAVLSLLLGAISWHAVERPFLRLKPRSPRRPSDAGSPVTCVSHG